METVRQKTQVSLLSPRASKLGCLNNFSEARTSGILCNPIVKRNSVFDKQVSGRDNHFGKKRSVIRVASWSSSWTFLK